MTGVRASKLLAYLKATSADVWVFTETRSEFSPGEEFELIAQSADAPDRGMGECWTATWVRRGIPGEQVPSANEERTTCARLRSPNGELVYVYGTVLPWLSDRRRSPTHGVAAFAAALAEQAADWQRLRHADPKAGLCVAGDFNQDLLPTGHYYGSAAGRLRLRGALIESGLRCLTGGEADPVAKLGVGKASIDHLCVAGLPFAAQDDAVTLTVWPEPHLVGSQLSDHYGVAATFARA